MALRSLAGKLRGFLPWRAVAPRSADFDLLAPEYNEFARASSEEKELAGFRTPEGRNVAKRTIENSRLFHEEAQKETRRINRNIVLVAATGVGISVFAVSRTIEKFEELEKVKRKAKALSGILEKIEELDNLKGEAQANALSGILEKLEELGEANIVSSILEDLEKQWEKEKGEAKGRAMGAHN